MSESPKLSLRTPIKVLLVAGLAELACVLLVHSSHRVAVAVVSGQTLPLELGGGAASSVIGWFVVAAQMASVLVLPPIMIAATLSLLSGCILHVVANRPFQRRRAVR